MKRMTYAATRDWFTIGCPNAYNAVTFTPKTCKGKTIIVIEIRIHYKINYYTSLIFYSIGGRYYGKFRNGFRFKTLHNTSYIILCRYVIIVRRYLKYVSDDYLSIITISMWKMYLITTLLISEHALNARTMKSCLILNRYKLLVLFRYLTILIY